MTRSPPVQLFSNRSLSKLLSIFNQLEWFNLNLFAIPQESLSMTIPSSSFLHQVTVSQSIQNFHVKFCQILHNGILG